MTMNINIAIVDYPYALQSAVFGIEEAFTLANKLQEPNNNLFTVDHIRLEDIDKDTYEEALYTAIFLPPSINSDFYLDPANVLISWLVEKHKQQTMLCSALLVQELLLWLRLDY